MIKGFFEVTQLVSVCEAQSLSPCTCCLSPPSGLGGNTGLSKRNAEGPEHRSWFNDPASESAPLWAAVNPGAVRHGPSVNSSSPTKDRSLDQSLCLGAWMQVFFPKNVKGGAHCCAPEPHPVHLGSIYPPRGWKKKELRGITARTPSFELGEEDQQPLGSGQSIPSGWRTVSTRLRED